MASYSTDVSEAAWALIRPHLPSAKPGRRPRSTDLRGGGECHLLPAADGLPVASAATLLPALGHVYHHFRIWLGTGVWVKLHRAVYTLTRLAAAGRNACP